jgi:hypothetical protein
MTNQPATGANATKSTAGRKPSVSEDQAAEVVERLQRERRPVTVGAVREELGGAPKTIKLLLEKIGALPTSIVTQSPRLVGLEKMFQQAVQEETLSIRLECQKQIDTNRDLLDQAVALLLDADADHRSADSKLKAAQAERDELRGRLDTTCAALDNANAELATTRAQAAAAAQSDAVARERLLAALSSSMAAEAKCDEERRQHSNTRDELARSKLALEASNIQAAEHQQDLIRAEESWAVERRLKDETSSMLFAILETAAEQDMPIREVLDRAHAEVGLPKPPGPGNRPGSLRESLKYFLDISKRHKTTADDGQAPGHESPTIPF